MHENEAEPSRLMMFLFNFGIVWCVFCIFHYSGGVTHYPWEHLPFLQPEYWFGRPDIGSPE